MENFVSKTQFLQILGTDNLKSILGAAKQSLDVEAWVTKFNAALEIDLEYVETKLGIQLLESIGIISAGTYNNFYPSESAPKRVRIKVPFRSAWPDEYDATQTGEVWTLIDSSAQFAPEFVEEI